MATEVGRIVARYIADTSSFDSGNARVKAGMASTGATARRQGASWAQYGKYMVLGVGAAVVGSLKSFALFDRNLNIFQANTDANTKTMKAASDAAMALGADMRFPGVTASHVAETLVELSKAGLDANQSIGALKSVMLLGTAGQLDYAEAGNITANAMNAFKLKTSDVPALIDDIAGAALKSSADVQGVAEAFRYTSAAAGGLGVPVDQVTTLIGALSNLGIKSDMAGTSMRMFFTSLAKPRSTKAFALMDDMHLIGKGGKSKFFDAKGEIKPINQIIALWKNATKTMSTQDRVGAEHTIFGVRGMNVARVMDDGVAAYNRLHKASTKKNAADKLAKANTKGLYGAYQGLVNVVQTLGIELGKVLAPTVIKLLDRFSKWLNVLERNKGVVKALGAAIVVVTAAWVAWRAIMILSNITMALSRVAMILFRTAVVAMHAPLQLLKIAQMQLNAALLANPIGLLIIAIIATILILRHFGVSLGDVKREALMVWQWMKYAFFGIKGAIVGALTTAINWIKGNWKTLLLVSFTGPFGLIYVVVRKFGHRLWDLFKEYAGKAVTALWNKLKSIPGLIGQAAGKVYTAAKSLGAKILKAIIAGVKSMPGALWSAIKGMVPGAGDKTDFMNKISGRALGGSVNAGTPYFVGERGRELFVPRRSGTIVPSGMGERGGPSVNIEHMSVRSEEDAYVIASVLGRRMQYAQ